MSVIFGPFTCISNVNCYVQWSYSKTTRIKDASSHMAAVVWLEQHSSSYMDVTYFL